MKARRKKIHTQNEHFTRDNKCIHRVLHTMYFCKSFVIQCRKLYDFLPISTLHVFVHSCPKASVLYSHSLSLSHPVCMDLMLTQMEHFFFSSFARFLIYENGILKSFYPAHIHTHTFTNKVRCK